MVVFFFCYRTTFANCRIAICGLFSATEQEVAMRFDDIESFSIDKLLLDEDNYRFQQAEDQEDCIDKIYKSNPSNFKRLMTSLAEDDLGEILLVYRDADEGTLIVLDGNRRTAALKVLNDPNLAPTAPLRKEAERLKSETLFDFDNIHAQVSEDKNLILRTVQRLLPIIIGL
jgi:hypothetical protein